jgi:hypothetical protein
VHRRRLGTLTALTALCSGLAVGLPVTSATAAKPRPVAARVTAVPVAGVDAAALRALPGPVRRPHVLTAPRATRGFTTLGLTWRHDPRVGEVDVVVRHRSGGRWSAWQRIEADPDHAPDPGSADDTPALRDGTAPMWVGPSDGVQVRVDRRSGAAPRDVRVELVDPGTSAADAPARLPRSVARAEEPQPSIVTRAEWGADESLRRGDPVYTSSPKVGFVHHTASSSSYSAAQAAAMVRSVYAFHVQSRGWSDIGYNLLVDRFGRVYEGRAGGVDKPVLGTHTGGHNSGTFAVSLLGTFDRTAPPAATMEALARTLAWKLGLSYRDPGGTAQLTSAGGGTSRFAAGTTNTFAVVSGHRDAGTTACPGGATYARMGEIRRAVKAYLGAGFVSPSLVGAAAREPGETEPFRLTTRTLSRTDWTLTVRRGGQVVRTLTGVADGSLTTAWDLRYDAGSRALPGTYVLTLSGTSGEDAALPWSTTVHVGGTGTSRWRPVSR